jgi:hypothetical protein
MRRSEGNGADTRGRARAADAQPNGDAPPLKERVLHTRIPAVLEEELKRAAKSLRVPVSNLVRGILEDAVAAAQAVGRAAEEELRGAADRLADERERLTRRAEASGEALARAAARVADEHDREPRDEDGLGILGYQPLVLATKTACSSCGVLLEVGERALLGVREGPGPRVIVCEGCAPAQAKDEE